MSRVARIVRNAAIVFGVVVVAVVIACFVIARTEWFRNYVRGQIISATENSTGGKVEIGSLDLDLVHLRAVATKFVIHGTEPAGSRPFVQVGHIEVDLRLFGIAYLGIEQPEVNVMAMANGGTNIPSPRVPSTSKETPLATVVDLAVRHFELRNGVANFDSRRQPLNIQANNVHAQLYYNVLKQGYQGQLELEPVYFVSGRNTPVTFKVTLPVQVEKDRVDFRHASISTAVSALTIDGSVENIDHPRIVTHVSGHVATIDIENLVNLPIAVNAKHVPAEIAFDLSAAGSSDRIDVKALRVTLGKSTIEASGPLKDPNGKAGLQFRTELALGELGRLMKMATPPEVVLTADGSLRMDADNKVDLQSNLGALDIQALTRSVGAKLPYDGKIAGSMAAQFDTQNVEASAHLSIVPTGRGLPLSGRINADYNGASDDIAVENSYLALPHSRLTVSGSIGKRLKVLLSTRDLSDFVRGVPVVLDSEAKFEGAVTGSLSSPRIAGRVTVNRFIAEGRAFSGLSAELAAASNNASVKDGMLTRGAMKAGFAAAVGLRNWSAAPRSPIQASVSITDGDVADALALAGEPLKGYSGGLTATAQVGGTVGNPQGNVSLQVGQGTLDGQPFDRIQAQVNMTDRLVTIPAAYIVSGASRLDLAGEFHHPRESFTNGTVHAHLQSNQVNLAQRANLAGTLQINADANGDLGAGAFVLTSLNGDASGHGLRWEGVSYGDVSLNASTSGNAVNYRATSNFAGSNIRLSGNTRLVKDYPTTADATIGNLAIEKVLDAARRTDIPARGILSGTAHVSGTMANPQGNADFDVSRAVVYDQALDRVHGRVTYLAQSIDVPQFEIAAGTSHLELTAHYDHPSGDLQQGNARFNIASSHIDIARFRPGFGGVVDVSANGAAFIHVKDPRVLFSSLNANVAATGLSAQGHNYGDMKLTATTQAGNRLSFALDSNLTGGTIRGRGTADLAGNYPVNAQMTFANMSVVTGGVDARTDGEMTISGPAMTPNEFNASLRLSKLSFTAPGTPVTIANDGPVSIVVDHGLVRIQNAHLTGPQTDIQVTGTASIKDQSLNATVNANADVGLAQKFDRDIYSSGKVVVATTVRGTMSAPTINGRVILQDATFNYAQLPIGFSKANGIVVFNGNSARIQNLTAESGGGKVSVSGFAGFSPVVRVGIKANATNVRVRIQEGVSVRADANVELTGTMDNSIVSGTATVEQVSYAPQSDIGSILTRAAPPVQAASAASPILENMKLDVRVRTSSGMAVQASLAENLQADADLRIRGTAAQPGVLGRITVDEGQLVFFGSEYTVDTGTISFYNPVRIEPILDVSLETEAQGVTVTLRVTGPIDNMKLSYTSDPPLQFQEIVALLAAGSTPTSDPTILANAPSQPSQGLQQMGESAILGKALADPVTSRLQRVFGLTQFKIDPAFTTGTSIPTASLTLQQRITNNLTFTYVSAVNDPNSTIIRIEWAFNPHYSAVATRDQNGIFSINFFYKRQFR
jgi:translocation and assembly module TamB